MNDTILLIFLCLLWGFLHSFLVSYKVKSFLKIRYGIYFDRYYRIVYNLFAAITILPILGLVFFLPGLKLYVVEPPLSWVFVGFQLIAFFLAIIAARQTGVSDLVGVTSSNTNLRPDEKKLKTGGLYRYVRHPIYSAGLIFLWCTSQMTVNYLTVAICFTIYIFIGTILEEKKLSMEFGEDYIIYKKSVPSYVPGLRWNKSQITTSEKNQGSK